ncbi:MAG: molybdopterin molybdotransferase MoeA [Methyloprofundus sp.]|nr:molybdopterin molybdotransferase MoeA [Methyloprofundus sp.]
MRDICSHNNLLSLEDALERIHQRLPKIIGEESITLSHALGRVLNQECTAPFDLPPFPNSSMDGYAFHSNDIQQSTFTLKQVGTSWAGKPFSGQVQRGECVRIFTGAVLPAELDSVIMQEQVHSVDAGIQFPSNTQAYENVRHAGEDVKKSDLLLPINKQLSATDIGLLASAGLYEIKVKRKLRIAFFSTGDELSPVGSKLEFGQIYDSNRYTLAALLSNPCYSVNDLGVMPDDKNKIRDSLVSAAKNNDVIISTGGASVGDADFIQEILAEIGQVDFWKLAIKPGKPLAFGLIENCCFFGLPGNPISVIATFQQVVAPALHQLSGLALKKPLRFTAVCKSPLYKKAGRQEFQRGILSQTEPGEFEVISAGKQGSNILSASSRANCYIILNREQENVAIDQTVLVEPFNTYLFEA